MGARRYTFKWARGGELPRAVRVGPHERQKILGPKSGSLPDDPPNFLPAIVWTYPDGARICFPHALGPALMARGNCGAKAPPPPRAQSDPNSKMYHEILRNLSFSIWRISGA